MTLRRLWLRLAVFAAVATALISLFAGLIGFLCVAGYLALRDFVSNGAALTIVGGSTIAAIVIVLAIGHMALGHASSSKSGTGAATPEALAVQAAAQVLTAMHKHPYHSALLSLGAGFVVGAVPNLRRTLLQALLRT